MRRVVLFVMALSLVGLTSAVASSFSVESEDIGSFTTSTSLTVPITTTRFPPTLWVRGPANDGILDLVEPTVDDALTVKEVDFRLTGSLRAEAGSNRYIVWEGPTAPNGGYLLQGSDIILHIEQDGVGTNRMTAGLFVCPNNSSHSSASCGDPIATGLGTPGPDDASDGDNDNFDYEWREVHFGALDVVIPQNEELRLKVVNIPTVSGADWSLRWGYVMGNASRLVIQP